MADRNIDALAAIAQAAEAIEFTGIRSVVPSLAHRINDGIRGLISATQNGGSAPETATLVEREALRTFTAFQVHERRYNQISNPDAQLLGWIHMFTGNTDARLDLRPSQIADLAAAFSPMVRHGVTTTEALAQLPQTVRIPQLYVGLITLRETIEIDHLLAQVPFPEGWEAGNAISRRGMYEEYWAAVARVLQGTLRSEIMHLLQREREAVSLNQIEISNELRTEISRLQQVRHGIPARVRSASSSYVHIVSSIVSRDDAMTKMKQFQYRTVWSALLNKSHDDPDVQNHSIISERICHAIERTSADRAAIEVPLHRPATIPATEIKSENRNVKTRTHTTMWDAAPKSKLPKRLWQLQNLPGYRGTTHAYIAEIFSRVTEITPSADDAGQAAGHHTPAPGQHSAPPSPHHAPAASHTSAPSASHGS